MQRKKIPQSVFYGLALLLVSLIVLIEHSLKSIYGQAGHPRMYLVLDLFSKACLSLFTGSIFFVATESFKERKARDKTEKVYRDFLDLLTKRFNTYIGRVRKVPPGEENDTNYLTTYTDDDLLQLITKNDPEQWMPPIPIGHANWLRIDLLQDRADVEPHTPLFSAAFNRTLNAVINDFDRHISVLDPRKSDALEWLASDIAMLRQGITGLETIYRIEHGYAVLEGEGTIFKRWRNFNNHYNP